jgi:RimJ/RimL family protein N-acetyltransferase
MIQSAIDQSVDSLLPWLPWAKGEPKHYTTKIDTLRYFRGSFDLGNDFVYGIFNAEETEVLGGCGLHTRAGKYALEIGYWISKNHQNKGYATEISRALVKTAFELSDIDNIKIYCDVDNTASLRVIEKVGFQKEGVLHHRQKDADGAFRDTVVAILLRDDYIRSDIRDDRITAYDAIDRELLA